MTTSARSSRRRGSRQFLVQKPQGQLSTRVQAVGPEHFGIVSVDCGKDGSKYMLADFYGQVRIEPTRLPHTRDDFQAAIEQIQQTIRKYDIHDFVAAIEQTGDYHRPVQRAFRATGWEVRLVHALASRHFRLPADPDNKTDDNDLAGIHRAAVNGFGLIEPVWPEVYQQLQLLERHRRDLVQKLTILCCQIREHLHALMPGYAKVFADDLWESPVALPVARGTGSAAAVLQAGPERLKEIVAASGGRCQQRTLTKIIDWAKQAPPAHTQQGCLSGLLANLDDDRQQKTQQIQVLEQQLAGVLVQTPYVLLLIIPGINVVSAAEWAGEMGPIEHYAHANHITGRAGIVPSRYQSERVDRPDGPLRRQANRRLRAATFRIADNLIVNNHHFQAKATRWRDAGKDPRWMRVKVGKSFTRIGFAMVSGPRLFRHPCCQQRQYLLDKLLEFHREHDTPMSQVLVDLQAATEQLPESARAAEAPPLQERLEKIQESRRGPQEIGNIIPIVLARLGVPAVQSDDRGDRDLS